MKIFNWVQRRFHQGPLKDGLARNVKKADSITSDADKQALLKQVALADVLDGWKDGILTIGTLGFDLLKPFNQQNEYFILESEEDEEVEEEGEQEQDSVDDDDEDNVVDEEVNPLIFTTFDHSFEDIVSNFDAAVLKTDGIMSVDLSQTEIDSSVSGIDQRKKKGNRITLAELFLADSDMKKKPDFGEIEPHPGKKAAVRTKNGLSFARKLMPHVGEDSHPIKKLHKLMRRMLKRKIHPEFEGKGNETDGQNKSGVVEVQTSKGNEASESASLLQAPPDPTI